MAILCTKLLYLTRVFLNQREMLKYITVNKVKRRKMASDSEKITQCNTEHLTDTPVPTKTETETKDSQSHSSCSESESCSAPGSARPDSSQSSQTTECTEITSARALPESQFQHVERKGDLFGCDRTTSLAHCVSVDLHMGKGIAVAFKNKFRGVEELRSQGKNIGQVAVLKKEDRYVYYLITKQKYWGKPTYTTLYSSLEEMKKHGLDNKVSHIAMPKIGCGLDGLKWDRVAPMIKDVFKDTNINITVYYL